jgi:hypothetical protein
MKKLGCFCCGFGMKFRKYARNVALYLRFCRCFFAHASSLPKINFAQIHQYSVFLGIENFARNSFIFNQLKQPPYANLPIGNLPFGKLKKNIYLCIN